MTVRPLLVVDDDIDHAVIVCTVLSSIAPDAEVETCTDTAGLPARLMEAQAHSLVLIDRMLNGVESLDLVRVAAASRPDLRMVVLSASLSAEDHERAIEAGAAEAAEKPASIAAWRDLLTGIIGRAGGSEASESRAG